MALTKIHVIYNKRINNDEKYIRFPAVVNGHTKALLPSFQMNQGNSYFEYGETGSHKFRD